MTGHPAGRIAIVVQEFPKLSQTFVVERVLGLLRMGWDVHVLCERSPRSEWARHPHLRGADLRERVHVSWPHGRAAAVLLPLGLVALCIGRPRRTIAYLRAAWPRFGARSLVRLYRDAQLVRLAPDVIHFEFGTLARSRAHVGALLGARTLVSFAGADVNLTGLDDPSFYAEVWRTIDAAHAPSEDNRRQALARGCPPDLPFAVIAPVMNLGRFEPSGRDPAPISANEPLRLVSVGRLHPKKGFDDALRAVRMVIDRGVPCVLRIVGEGAERDALLALRGELGLEGAVELTGPIPWEQVREQLRWADVFVHAATSEGFGIVVTEAQATAIPVVTTDAEGLAENVVDRVTGFVVARREPGALADRIAELGRDPELRRRMGESGRIRAQTEFGADRLLQRYAELYASLTGPRPSTPEERPARTGQS
jgi:colanic acid/amylovoran biosynthesis glycosyltransferase